MEPTFTLADDVIAVMGNPNRGLASNNIKNKRSKEAMSRVQSSIRSSRKFVLDDDLVEFAATMSTLITAEQLVSMIRNYVRCPYPHNWIEWDEVKRVTAVNKTVVDHPDRFHAQTIRWSQRLLDEGPILKNLARRVGYHVADSQDVSGYAGGLIEAPELTASGYYIVDEKQDAIMASPVGFTIKLESGYTEQEDRLRLSNFLGRKPTGEELFASQTNDQLQTLQLLSHWWTAVELGLSDEELNREPDIITTLSNNQLAMNRLVPHFRPIQTHAIHWFLNTEMGFDEGRFKDINKLGVQMCEGDPRFLLTVIALLNHDWTIKDLPPQRMKGTRRRWGNYIRGNAYHVISIKLPKNRGIEVAMSKFSESKTQRRLHQVRGHYVYVSSTGKRHWRKSHPRGDAKLGVITHDYELTGGDQEWKGSKHV